MASIIFFDTEIDPKTGKILDIGAVRDDGVIFHQNSIHDFLGFLQGTEFVCGHNVLSHDMKYVGKAMKTAGIDGSNVIDTLYLSPLMFPKKPYHSLLKDDKLLADELSNPLNDSEKARELFDSECTAFNAIDEDLKEIYYSLLENTAEFGAFFRYAGYRGHSSRESGSVSLFMRSLQNMFRPDNSAETADKIKRRFREEICINADISGMVRKYPIGLAYCLALIDALDKSPSVKSVTPPWVLHNYPEVEQLMFRLRNSPCLEGCPFCNKAFDIHAGLKEWFGFGSFREYGGVPLQEQAVRAAVENKSLLAVFPTGGGKSLTFQLPALMAGRHTGGLTVVISPLQSLMKDQVDNLEKKGITDAVTINGLLDPIERSKAVERVEDGSASLLYISPESLRSRSIERLLLSRKIVRIVIDEAHCFSSWGQDFRVDYLYIAEFIRNLQHKKHLAESIPVSCFTATAKVKVIEDISAYFRRELSLDLMRFTASASRHNLHYTVLPEENEEDKYRTLRRLIEERDCPVIVYVTRTRKAEELARRLADDGFMARAFHGKMDSDKKTANQNSFMTGETKIMVATSAFGMGVDKSDVGLVVHYQISDSLENYVQEAGRAGRDEHIDADCYVLYNEEDLSRHFILLNQTKLTIKEIQQVWKAVKEITRTRSKVSNSALEIARKAGWDDGVADIETRVKTAIASLEQAGYLKRGQNIPRVFATGILAHTAQEAIDRIEQSGRFDCKEKTQAIRIIKSLISSRSIKKAQGEEAESRVDYISDHLGISKENVIHIINLLREEKILADSKDLTAYIGKDDTQNKSRNIVRKFNDTELFLAEHIPDGYSLVDLKELNALAETSGHSSVDLDRMKTLLNFWAIKNWIKKHSRDKNHLEVRCLIHKEQFAKKIKARQALATYIIDYLYEHSESRPQGYVEFSVLELKESYENSIFSTSVSVDDIEDALFYLSRVGAISIEGGFMVIYNALSIERLEKDNHIRYKVEDYQKLNEFYKNKMQQIHIVGEYAKKMLEDYDAALKFVEDYFSLNYPDFLNRYFNGRKDEISVNMTPAKFRRLFGELTPSQLSVVKDRDSRCIVVAAGPGSGKTRVLVHKLASLLLMEDVKHEQLLMLTFSRAAATEFRQRLRDLIGNAVSFVEIRTFHSYCFDLLGKIGSIKESESIVRTAVEKILSGEVDASRITKTVLVIDEAQDMDEDEYRLVRVLMEKNEDMRVIAVGDDDQNIYAFRGSSSEYMEKLLQTDGARKYELVENFRSRNNLVAFANAFAENITHRIKSFPVMPVTKEDGEIEVTSYCSSNLDEPLVNDILRKGLSGTTAVLTKDNEEALVISGILQRKGYPAQLIRSNSGFWLSKLAEIRYFMTCLDFWNDDTVVPWEKWQIAKNRLKTDFARSRLLGTCLDILDDFESVCPDSSDTPGEKVIYKTDFDIFLKESSFEDFARSSTDAVTVSTMHKVKGMEFDNVFLMLDNFICTDDEKRRQLYVALTRARNNLYIHDNTGIFRGISAGNLVVMNDYCQYDRASETVLQLGLTDVWLDDFECRQYALGDFMSGDALYFRPTLQGQPGPYDGSGDTIHGKLLLTDSLGRTVLQCSRSFMVKYEKIIRAGYRPEAAEVNMVVWWKNDRMKDEIKVLLPTLYFSDTPCRRPRFCRTESHQCGHTGPYVRLPGR